MHLNRNKSIAGRDKYVVIANQADKQALFW